MTQPDLINRLAEAVARGHKTLVLPEPDDARVIEAAAELAGAGIARVALVGDDAAANRSGRLPDSIRRIDPTASADLESYAERYCRSRRRTSPKVARRLLTKPLFFAGMMVAAGDADALLAGVAHPSARVLEACLMTVGLADGIETPSSSFLLFPPDDSNPAFRGPLLFADCALNIAPGAGELADIGVASARRFAALTGETPRVAFLSFSTKGSASHERATLVADAAAIAARAMPDVAVDGELQLDAALSPGVAALKLAEPGNVAGRANVLVFPSLEAANIGYKLVQQIGGARAYGPLLQGFAKPVSDLSRGASVDDIVSTAILTLALGVGN